MTVHPPPGRRDLAPQKQRVGGRGTWRRTKEWTWDGNRGRKRAGRKAGRQHRWRFGQRMDSREEDDRQSKGRRHGGNRRDLEHAAPGGTQATAIMVTHGGANGGRSHGGGRADDFKGPTNGGGAGGGGARGGDGEPMSQGDRGGAEGKEEPDRACGTRCSRRSGVLRWRMVADRPRRSRRDKGARRSRWVDGPRRSPGL